MLFANRFSKFFYHKWKHFAIVVWKLLQNTLTTAGKIYYPEFDTKNNKKVSEALILLACGTFPNFAVTRYFSCLLVSAQIFFIFLTGTISLDVQKPNAS